MQRGVVCRHNGRDCGVNVMCLFGGIFGPGLGRRGGFFGSRWRGGRRPIWLDGLNPARRFWRRPSGWPRRTFPVYPKKGHPWDPVHIRRTTSLFGIMKTWQDDQERFGDAIAALGAPSRVPLPQPYSDQEWARLERLLHSWFDAALAWEDTHGPG